MEKKTVKTGESRKGRGRRRRATAASCEDVTRKKREQGSVRVGAGKKREFMEQLGYPVE